MRTLPAGEADEDTAKGDLCSRAKGPPPTVIAFPCQERALSAGDAEDEGVKGDCWSLEAPPPIAIIALPCQESTLWCSPPPCVRIAESKDGDRFGERPCACSPMLPPMLPLVLLPAGVYACPVL